ncbi:MAG: tyrosine--tRNA ligase [Streptosporangiaceae bacterium]
MDLLADLEARGLVQDSTDRDALRKRLAAGPARIYYGCGPSADSLHVGNLIGLLVLRRFADAGHQALALAGGATVMIGDPGGRSKERNLLDEEALARNTGRIAEQLERISRVPLVNNLGWTASISLLSFLRDIGKHATANQMMRVGAGAARERQRYLLHRVQLPAAPGARLPAPLPHARRRGPRSAALTNGATSSPAST